VSTSLGFNLVIIVRPDFVGDGTEQEVVDHRDVITLAGLDFMVPAETHP
jgi:hypothetical protein